MALLYVESCHSVCLCAQRSNRPLGFTGKSVDAKSSLLSLVAGSPYYQRDPTPGSPPEEDTLADLLSLQQLISWRDEAEQPFRMWLLLQTKTVVAGQPEIVWRPFWLRITARGGKIGALKKAVSESEGRRSNENMFPSQKAPFIFMFFLVARVSPAHCSGALGGILCSRERSCQPWNKWPGD